MRSTARAQEKKNRPHSEGEGEGEERLADTAGVVDDGGPRWRGEHASTAAWQEEKQLSCQPFHQ
jgi:hypothetical protein